MNFNLFVVCTLIVTGLLLVPSVQGVNLLTIDTFVTGGSATSIIYTITAYGTPTTWYSPYNLATPPQAKFFTTTDALGGQRDLILGYVDPVPIGSTAIVNIVSRRASISFPLNWIGGAYFQWDGIDDAGSGTAFPGATLNPGLTAPVDITFNGRANGLALSITSDQDTDYRVTLVNTAGTRNQYRFILRANEPAFTFVPLLYSSSIWNSPGFNFADVRGFEVQIQTGTDTSSNAPDTQFTPLFIFSYAISGNAGLRCNCLQTTLDSELSGAQIDLYTSANVFIRSTTTDVNGDYTFWALNAVSYNVCFHDTTALLCSSSPRCVAVTIDPLAPANVYSVNFVKTVTTTFTIPPDQTGDCAACKIPDGTSNCPPFATITGCTGGTTTVTNFSDVTTGNTCSTQITRTWTSPDDGSKKTQRLTFTDTTAPVFTVPPQDLTQDCNAVSTSINAWVTANAFSTVTDNCSPTIVTNNWNGASVGNCNAATVTFSLRDSCGNTATPRTATYRIRDVTSPTITQVAANSQAECDLKQGSDQTALNAWVQSRGGAQASDNCATSVTWTNDFTPLTSGCLVSRTVTFTANDGCSNTASTTATFTIRDTKAPTITVAAQAASAQCSGTTSATQAFTSWRNSHGGAQATDQCVVSDTSLTWTDDFTGVVSGGCNNAFPVTFTVNDLCGFSASTTATFTVLDNTGPTLVTPASPQSIECGSTSIDTAYNTWLASNGGAVATDACTAVVWSNNAGPTPTNGCNSVSTVTFRATDSCNNAAVQTTATFTVRDTTPPTFVTPPANSGQECSGNVNVGFSAWLTSNAGATATDTCSLPVSIINDFPTNGTPAVGCSAVTTVKFTAVDACNRSSQPISATYTVTDTTPPTINPGASDVNKECNTGTNGQDYQTFLNTKGGAVATDFCSSFTWTNDGPAQLTFTCTVTQRVTFTARDACGNAASTTATFSVNDTTAPTIVQPAADRTTQCNTGGSGTNTDLTNWLNSRGGATASDNCGQVTWTNDFTALTVQSSCTSFATVTFSANDGCGHSVQTTATFTVTDNIGPTINPPAQALTVQCDPTSNDSAYAAWTADHGGARATDNCVPSDQLLWTVNDPIPISDACGSQSVTFTVTDGCGSASATTALFTIIDTNKPAFTTPPQSVSFECDGAGNTQQYSDWVTSFGGAVADDVCATLLTYATNAPLTGPVGCGSQPQTVTVTDECNNAAIASSVFTIVDTQAPTIVTPASDISIQCNPSTNTADINAWLASKGGAEATDICYSASSLSWSNNYIGLSTAACNPTARVIFTVSDPCGNKQTTTASVTIVDTLVPILSSAATPAVFECNIDQNPVQVSNYVTSHGGAQATDTCSSITWSNNFINAPAACVGPLPVIFTASDACGNRISSTGSIEIIDSVAPAFVNFPADITVGCDKSTDPDATGIPDWSDACTTSITPTYSDVSFQKPTEKFCPGDVITTRTWTLVDSCGNSNSKDQIIVEEITRPVGPCLPSECPPCELVECCTTPLADIECNPVACTAVRCSAVPCSAVPCIPRSCGVPPTPTGKPEGPVPLPSVLPAPSCEPVYIYVFDDDGEDVPVEPIIVYTTNNDSASLGLSLISLVIILFVTIF